MRERPDSFIRSAGVISALTLLSRLLGVVRDIACAAVFGAGVVWDAFSFAFRIPNLFRRLFGEGALSAAFLPVFTEHLALNRPQEAWRLAGRVAGALALVLSGILLLGEAALAAMLGLMELSARWRLALMLTAVLLPYMVLICMTALAGAALNSMKRFAMPALAPVVLNACWIAAVLVAAPLVSARPEGRIMAVAAGILLAGVLQLWLQLAALRRLGVRLRLSFSLMHPQVRRVAAAMAPVALGLAAFQINVLLDGVIAISLAGPAGGESFRLFGATLPYPMEVGANSVLYYGNRLMQFPLGVFGIALATAVFPTLSHHAARRDWAGFSGAIVRGLGAALFIAIPASVGLAMLGRPIAALLFERGEFTARMTARTARVLTAYSVGMWAYFALHLLARAFYSLGRQSTPARVAAAMVAVNLALNLALVWPLREAGLAAATSLSAMLQVVCLVLLLRRHVALPGLGRLAEGVVKTSAATLCMAGAVWGTLAVVPPGEGLGERMARGLLPAATGAAIFIAAAAALRSPELALLWRSLRRPRERPGPTV